MSQILDRSDGTDERDIDQPDIDQRLARIPNLVDVDAHVVEPPRRLDLAPTRQVAVDVGPRVELLPAGTPKLVGTGYVEAPGTDGPPVAWWRYEDASSCP